jgi:hypothetical protein
MCLYFDIMNIMGDDGKRTLKLKTEKISRRDE